MAALLASLLQAALALYVAAQNPALSADLRAQANALGNTSLLLYQKASTPWLAFNQLANAKYTDPNGNSFTLANGFFYSDGLSAQIVSEHTSFGDLNKDLLDDAVVVLKVTASAEPARYAAAVVMNMNEGKVSNAASLDLGQSVEIFDHRIQNGQFKLDIQADNGLRATRLYKLEGGVLKLVNQI